MHLLLTSQIQDLGEQSSLNWAHKEIIQLCLCFSGLQFTVGILSPKVQSHVYFLFGFCKKKH